MEEAGQIVQVSVEGFKFIFEATAQSIETMKKVLSLVQISAKMTKDLWNGTLETGANMIKLPFKAAKGVNDLKYVKNSGKTNKDNFNLRRDSTGQFLKLEKSAAKDFEKYAKKSGILYVKMRGLDKDSKTVHYLFQSSDAPIINTFLTNVLQNNYRKKAFEEVKAKYKGKSRKEVIQEMAEDITLEKMKENTYETPEQYGISEKFDKMTYKEFQEKVREVFPEYEDMINEVFSGYESKAETESKGGKKKETGVNEEKEIVKSNILSEHIKEIQHAINNNELNKNVNRANMIYTEINDVGIIGEDKEKGTVEVVSPNNTDLVAQIPKKSIVKIPNSNSYVFVSRKEDEITVNNIENSGKTVNKQNVSALDFKKMFNRKINSGRSYDYSEDFRRMFTMKDNVERVKANTGGRSRK